MQQSGPLDALPLPGVYLIITLVALLAVELGFRLARNRLLRSLRENEAPVGVEMERKIYLIRREPLNVSVELGCHLNEGQEKSNGG